jgi:hypothetical protein
VPQDSGCKFLYKHKEVAVMSSTYISTSCREVYGGNCHVYISLTPCFDEGLGSALTLYDSISAVTLDGRSPSHLLQQNRSVRLVYTHYVGKARMKSYLDYILSGRNQGSFVSAKSTADPRRCPYLLSTSSIRLSGSYLTCGARSYEERLRVHPESLHLG